MKDLKPTHQLEGKKVLEKYLNFSEVSLISLSGDKWLICHKLTSLSDISFSIAEISSNQIKRFKKDENYTIHIPIEKYKIVNWVFSKYGGGTE